MAQGPLVVTIDLSPRSRGIVAKELGGVADIVYLRDLDQADRASALSRAGAVLAYNTAAELDAGELPLIAGARLLQYTTAGIDWIPLSALPPGLPVACNAGA